MKLRILQTVEFVDDFIRKLKITTEQRGFYNKNINGQARPPGDRVIFSFFALTFNLSYLALPGNLQVIVGGEQ